MGAGWGNLDGVIIPIGAVGCGVGEVGGDLDEVEVGLGGFGGLRRVFVGVV